MRLRQDAEPLTEDASVKLRPLERSTRFRILYMQRGMHFSALETKEALDNRTVYMKDHPSGGGVEIWVTIVW